MHRRRTWSGIMASLAFIAAACSSGGGATPTPALPTSVGPGEGQLKLVAWAGYVENGSNDPAYDWVTQFQTDTGCIVTAQTAGTSDEMVRLMATGEYDGVSASGNASVRLVASGDAAPINVDLVPNYKDVYAALKDQPYNTVNGVHYGIPHGRGANALAWRSDTVTSNLDSWSVMWDTPAALKGKLSVYDDPIYMADAAVYLMSTQPALGITNPYELDQKQFDAVVALLKAQRPNIGEYWNDATKQIQSFTTGAVQVGTTWQYQINTMAIATPPVPIGSNLLPKEGSTGWSDTWMLYSKAKHPNCMYKWLDWIISPEVNAKVAVWFGEAPSNPKACATADTLEPGHCDLFHANDETYFSKVYEWTVPQKDCGDARGAVCKGYDDWLKAWTEIKG
ncbi:MAG: extracellular solute-binding protein [Candidatus Limnocylindrales bacterium]